jgi:Domain of unknown function (DUF6089)
MTKNSVLFWFLFIFFGLFFSVKAQKIEIGGGIGPTYYKGDLQPGFRIFTPKAGINVFGRYNYTKSISAKANAFFGLVGGADKNSGNPLNIQRGYSFTNTLWDYNGQVEYNFLNFRTHNGRFESRWTPYLFGGYGMHQILKKKLTSPTSSTQNSKTGPDNIFLYGIGFKKIYRGQFNFGAEFGTRVLLSQRNNDSFDSFGYNDDKSTGIKNKLSSGYPGTAGNARLNYPNTLQRDKYFYVNVSFSYLFYKIHCPPGY